MANWPCRDPKCLAELKLWLKDEIEWKAVWGAIGHCAFVGCHGVVWCEKGLKCIDCSMWHCLTHWQTTGGFDRAQTWHCAACRDRSKVVDQSEDEGESVSEGGANDSIPFTSASTRAKGKDKTV